MNFDHWDKNYLGYFDENPHHSTGSAAVTRKHPKLPSPVSPCLHESLKNLVIEEENGISPTSCNIMRIIGVGSFGRVHLIQQQKTCKYFALKVLNKAILGQHNQLEQAGREIEILSHIQHPFIIRMHSSCQDAQNIYIVLEYVPGGELFRLFKIYGVI